MRVATLLLGLLGRTLIVHSATTDPVGGFFGYAACVALCAEKYCERGVVPLLSGEVDSSAFFVHNNSDFSLCKVGCVLPKYDDVSLDSFKDGQRFSAYNFLEVGDVPPPASVSVLCVESFNESKANSAKIVATVTPPDYAESVAFVVEVIEAAGTDEHGSPVSHTLLDIILTFSGMAVVSVKDVCADSVYLLRATTLASGGRRSATKTSSRWYSGREIAFRFSPAVQLFVRSLQFVEDSISAVLGLSVQSSLPFCSLAVGWSSGAALREKSFQLDRSMSVPIDGLRFESEYSVVLFANVNGTSRAYLSNESFILRTPSCVELTAEPSLCAPSPVSNLTWSSFPGGGALLSWNYLEFSEGGDRSMAAGPVHFVVVVEPLITFRFYHCCFLKPSRFILLSSRRSLDVSFVEGECNYEASVVVIDARNRSSAPSVVRRLLVEQNHSERSPFPTTVLLVLVAALCITALTVAIVSGLLSGRLTRVTRNPNESLSRAAVTSGLPASYFSFEKPSDDGTPCLFESLPNTFSARRHLPVSRLTDEDIRSTPTSVFQAFLCRREPIFNSRMSLSRDAHSFDLRHARPEGVARSFGRVSSVGDLSAIGFTETPSTLWSGRGRSLASMGAFSAFGSSPCVFSGVIATNSSYSVTPVSTRQPTAQLNPSLTKLGVVLLDDITFLNQLGSGNFGTVKLVRVYNHRAAFKSVRGGNTCSYRRLESFYREAQVSLELCTTGHQNIVQLLALCCDSVRPNELCGLLYEYCEGGDLKFMLTSRREKMHLLSMESSLQGHSSSVVSNAYFVERQLQYAAELTRFAFEVARAMEFVSSRRYVHRDIAARNVLLTRAFDASSSDVVAAQSVKLADYGLCVCIGESKGAVERRKCNLPLKWLPYEFWFDNCYGLEGDVWEYGCLLIEMLTLGDEPCLIVFDDESPKPRKNICEYIETISSGFSVFDDAVRDSLLLLVRNALKVDKAERPSFSSISNFLLAKVSSRDV